MARKRGRKSNTDMAREMCALLAYLGHRGLFDDVPSNSDGLGFDTVMMRFGWDEDKLISIAEMLACCARDSYLLVPIVVDRDARLLRAYAPFTAFGHPLQLSSTERTALVAALSRAGVEDRSLYGKLLPSDAGNEGERMLDSAQFLDSAGGNAHSEGLLLLLAQAIHGHRVVRIGYRNADEAVTTTRDVEPMSFSLENGTWYLHAFCRLRGSLRTFTLRRIEDACMTDEGFEPRALKPVPWQSLLADGLDTASLRIEPEMRIESREWPGLEIKGTEPDGARTAHIPYGNSLWLPRHVTARFGGVRIEEPGDLRDRTAQLARDMHEHARTVMDLWEEAVATADARCWDRSLHVVSGADSAREALVETLSRTAS